MMSGDYESVERASRIWRFSPNVDTAKEGTASIIRDIASLIFRNKFKLIISTLAGLALAAIYAHSLPPVYSASATLLLDSRQVGVPGQDVGILQALDLNRADSELQIIKSERLLSAIFESLKLGENQEFQNKPDVNAASYVKTLVADVSNLAIRFQHWLTDPAEATPRTGVPESQGIAPSSAGNERYRAAFEKFSDQLTVRRVGQSYVIEIGYSSTDQTLPAKVANAAVSGYIMQAVSFKAQMIRAGSEPLQGRLNSLNAQVDAANEAMRLGTLPALPTPDADARIIGAALTPLQPSSPRVKLIVLLGGVIGLVFGSSLVTLITLCCSPTVLSVQQLAKQSGVPCLGTMPSIDGRPINSSRRLRRQDEYAVALRDIRTSIEIACSSVRAERGIVVGIVGWNESDSITTLSGKLAQLMRRSGRHVTLFQSDADKAIGASGDPAASYSLADISVLGMRGTAHVIGIVDGVEIVPIHSINKRSNLIADFRSKDVSKAIDAARRKGDVVLGLPTLQSSRDAIALASYADVVMVVAVVGETTIDDVNKSIEQLRQSHSKVIGTVITGV